MCCVWTKHLKRNNLMSNLYQLGFQGTHEHSGLLDIEEKLMMRGSRNKQDAKVWCRRSESLRFSQDKLTDMGWKPHRVHFL